MLLDDPAGLSFTQIAEAYLELRQEGESISVEQFAEVIPAYREEILKRLPVMVLLADTLGPEDQGDAMTIGRNTVIDGCRIEEEIGRGASAVVFRAHQADFDRKVAIKVMSKNETWSARFRVERRAMARLDHPNIVHPYAYVEHDDYDCLIMKYVDGFSLHELINDDCDYQGRVIGTQLRSDWDQFAILASDVADALAHAHQNGIIHRDIKPSNLLVDVGMKVWVTDFGLTKVLDDQVSLSRTGDAVGTPRFMAPEQFHGGCDERSDIYSLGLTLYTLAAGTANYIRVAANPGDSSSGVVKDLTEVNPEVPGELAKVIMKATQLDPNERYQTADELRIVLERFLAGRVPDRRHRNRNKRRWYVRKLKQKAALAGLVGATAVGAYYTRFESTGINSFAGSETLKNETVIPKAPLSGVSLLDGLVDDGPKGVDRIVKDVVRQSVDEAASSINLPVSETNALQARIDSLMDTDSLHDKSVKELVEGFRSSPLADATRILRLTRVVHRSTMTPREKTAGVELVRQFAYLVARKDISRTEADQLERYLTFNRKLSATELNATRFTDQRLRSWLHELYKKTRGYPKVNSVSDEIDALFKQMQRN